MVFRSIAFAALLAAAPPALLCRAAQPVPEFEFDVWGSPPSAQVIKLTEMRDVQRILYFIRNAPLAVDEIAARCEEPAEKVRERLAALEGFHLVLREGERWRSNIAMYDAADLRAAEAVNVRWARKEAAILRESIPALKAAYWKTTVSKAFPWDRMSLIITGALVTDFGVFDRAPYRSEHPVEDLQQRLPKPAGGRWDYTGFEKLEPRYPSRAWKFYQNVYSRHDHGMARFGYFRYPDEKRKAPARPESLGGRREGEILFALAEGPLAPGEIAARTGLPPQRVAAALKNFLSYQPPAVAVASGRYTSLIPILTESDLKLMLAEADRVSTRIFLEVAVPHRAELRAKGRERASPWPLPADTYVRDKALQILIEEGLLAPVPAPPVDWNFGVWGWHGFLAMQEEITSKVEPEPFLRQPVTAEENKRIEEFESARLAILAGKRFNDTSTPERAMLTRISGWVNRDVEALRSVEVPWDKVVPSRFDQPQSLKWTEYLKQLRLWRSLPPQEARDGDVAPVFMEDAEGDRDAYGFVRYGGRWWQTGNMGGNYGLWRMMVGFAKTRLEYLRTHLPPAKR